MVDLRHKSRRHRYNSLQFPLVDELAFQKMYGQHMCYQATDERGCELNKATLSESTNPLTFLGACIRLEYFMHCTDVPKTRTDYFWGLSSVAKGKVAAMADHFELGCPTLYAT